MLPWITSINKTGMPADLNVNNNTVKTIRMDTTLTTTLSTWNDFSNSYWLVEFPTTYTIPFGYLACAVLRMTSVKRYVSSDASGKVRYTSMRS